MRDARRRPALRSHEGRRVPEYDGVRVRWALRSRGRAAQLLGFRSSGKLPRRSSVHRLSCLRLEYHRRNHDQRGRRSAPLPFGFLFAAAGFGFGFAGFAAALGTGVFGFAGLGFAQAAGWRSLWFGARYKRELQTTGRAVDAVEQHVDALTELEDAT